MQGYTDIIRKYATDESHVGLLTNPDGIGEVGLTAAEKGTRLAVRFTLQVENDQILKVRFQAFGCGFTIAACSAAAELCQGRSLQDIQQYTATDIEQRLGGLPSDRSYCAELANQALHAAISSVRQGRTPFVAEFRTEQKEGPLVNRRDPFYRSLLETPAPPGIFLEDRQMFAGLLTLAHSESNSFAKALGLKTSDVDKIFSIYFPGFDPYQIRETISPKNTTPPDINRDVLKILQSHVPCDLSGKKAHTSDLLAKIIATRAGHPGHLWVSMGFFERPQLTAAIRRHLPTLAIANDKGMRWKRYLFKQACDLNGGVMCKTPNCSDCSDYQLCFAPEEVA